MMHKVSEKERKLVFDELLREELGAGPSGPEVETQKRDKWMRKLAHGVKIK
jgi:hypothetical protein